MFMAGKRNWGVYQRPSSFERMQNHACTAMRGCHLLGGARHGVQQEQPERVSQLLTQFLHEQASGQACGVKPVTA